MFFASPGGTAQTGYGKTQLAGECRPRGLNSLLKNSIAGTSAAKAWVEMKGFIAALEALRHPKSEFFSKL